MKFYLTVFFPVSVFKSRILTIAYSLKSVGIANEWICDHNDTNKRKNFLNLICTLNPRLITLKV